MHSARTSTAPYEPPLEPAIDNRCANYASKALKRITERLLPPFNANHSRALISRNSLHSARIITRR